jgi:hypothetical protein
LSLVVTNCPQQPILFDPFGETPDAKDEMTTKDQSRTCLGET